MFHCDPPEATIVSSKHNGVARIVLTCECSCLNCPFGLLLHCRDTHPCKKFGMEIEEIHVSPIAFIIQFNQIGWTILVFLQHRVWISLLDAYTYRSGGTWTFFPSNHQNSLYTNICTREEAKSEQNLHNNLPLQTSLLTPAEKVWYKSLLTVVEKNPHPIILSSRIRGRGR